MSLVAAACGDDDAATTTAAPTTAAPTTAAPDTGPTGEITISLYPDWDFLKDGAEQYMEANPGTTITLEAIAGVTDDYFVALPRILGTTEAADLTVVRAGRGEWAELAATGHLADVSEVWDELGLEDILLGPVVESYTEEDGTHLAVSTGLNWIPLIYYNKTLFSDLGLSIPDDHRIASEADWLAITDALAAEGKLPFALNTVFGGRYLWMQMSTSNCGTQWMHDLMASASPGAPALAKYNDACSVEVWEKIADWRDRGIFGDSPGTIDRSIAESLFFSETAGMYLSGSWETGPITDADLPFDVDWFILPDMAAEEMKFGLETYDALGMAANSDNPELAMDFLKFAASKEFQEYMVRYARFSTRTDMEYDRETIPELALTQFDLLPTYAGTANPNVVIHPRLKTFINDTMVELLVGTITPVEFGDALESIADEIRAG
jgi:raffinose/stachyose/melibiose transport system substrate-binding protein